MANRKAGKEIDWNNSILHGLVFWIFTTFMLGWIDYLSAGELNLSTHLTWTWIVPAMVMAIPFFFMGFISRIID